MNIIVESNQEEFETRKKFFAWLDNNKTRSVWAWIIENFEPKQVKVEPEVILPKPNQPIFTITEVERMLADQRLSCMKQRYYYRYKGVKKMEEAILNAPPPQEFIDKIIVKIP